MRVLQVGSRLAYGLVAGFLLCIIWCSEVNAQYRSGYSELADSERTSKFKSHISFLSSDRLEGRGAGSVGEKDAADYVRGVMEEYGLEILSGDEGDLFGIRMESGDTLTSRNVVGCIQGYDRDYCGKYIVVGARLDNLGKITVNVDGEPSLKYYNGANGNASGLAMMLELARLVSTNKVLFRRSVLFVAFGASTHASAGSWYFLNRSFKDSADIEAMINLDMLGTGNSGFYAYTSSNPDMNMILSQVGAELQPIVPKLTSEEPYMSDHRSFYAKEIPSVMFTTGRYPEHNTFRDKEEIIEYGPMERILEYLYNYTRFIANVQNPPLFTQDKSLNITDGKTYTYDECDKRPTFMGSADPKIFLLKWVYQYLKYPHKAVEQGIQGRVVVGFTVNPDGKVSDVYVARGADPLLDEEAVKVVAASPKWKAGTVKGKKVPVTMTVAVDFMLQKKGKFGIKK